MVIGEIYAVGSDGMEMLCRMDNTMCAVLHGKEYKISIDNCEAIKMTNITCTDDLEDMRTTILRKLQSEVVKKKDDISILEAEIKFLVARATKSENNDDGLPAEIAKKTVLLRQHRRDINNIKLNSSLKLKYIETQKIHTFTLLPFKPQYIDLFEREIMWCPVRRNTKKRKRQRKSDVQIKHIAKTINQRFSAKDIEKSSITESKSQMWDGKSSITSLKSLIGCFVRLKQCVRHGKAAILQGKMCKIIKNLQGKKNGILFLHEDGHHYQWVLKKGGKNILLLHASKAVWSDKFERDTGVLYTVLDKVSYHSC